MIKPVRERMYGELKSDILSRKLPPGQRLTEMEVAKRFQVSRTPARTVLNLLESEGLLQRQGSGLTVARLRPKDIRDLMYVRMALDGIAARLAAENLSAEELAELERIFQTMQRELAQDRLPAAAQYDRLFHEAIARASQNPYLVAALQKQLDSLHAFRLYSYSVHGMTAKSIEDHQAILMALKQRDAAGAEAQSRRHVQNVLKTVVENLQGHPVQW